jgi:hypothetical protein
MIFNILIAGIVLGLAYAWMVRGFFSAFLHLLCVLIAGALAFAVWEPGAYLLMGASPDSGLLSFVESGAWGIALILPFAVFLLLFRLVADKVVRSNIKNAGAVDYAGGAVCGLGVGIITAGIFVIGIQGMRLPTNMGYRPIWYTEDRAAGAGSLVQTDRLWIPADRLTSALFGKLSEGSMSSPESLAKWHPNLESVGFAARLSPGDGAGRNIIGRDDFQIIKTYTVGPADRAAPAADLLLFEGAAAPQRYLDVRGRAPGQDGTPNTGRLVGYVLEFQPGAKERGKSGGQLILSNGQVSMVARNSATGESIAVFPLAAISENTTADGRLGRWRFDADDVFISSVGGQSNITVGFEFFVPDGFEPIGLSVRQTRALLAGLPEPVVLADTDDRDRRVRSGSIFESETRTRRIRDDSDAIRVDPSTAAARGGDGSGIALTNSVGEIIPSQIARSRLTLDDDNLIADGQAKFLLDEVGRANAPTARNMRVDSFALGRNQAMVQVDVSPGQAMSFASEAARLAPTDQPIVLIDSGGNEYRAIGFVYQDREIFELRYTPGSTLAGVEDTPPVSSTRDDQTLKLLFIVTNRVTIEQLAIGDIVLANFVPPLNASSRP